MVVERGGIADWVKVLDFGLVKALEANAVEPREASLTAGNIITGTPLYMAPEAIVAPDTVGPGVDVYALGAVGYWLLTGTHVFSGNTIVEICAHHLHSAPEAPSVRLRGSVAADLESLSLECLAKSPEDRPTSAAALHARLRACGGAGGWNNERAAVWWRDHRDEARRMAAARAETDDAPDRGGRAQRTVNRASLE